jgi:hypothetical protein
MFIATLFTVANIRWLIFYVNSIVLRNTYIVMCCFRMCLSMFTWKRKPGHVLVDWKGRSALTVDGQYLMGWEPQQHTRGRGIVNVLSLSWTLDTFLLPFTISSRFSSLWTLGLRLEVPYSQFASFLRLIMTLLASLISGLWIWMGHATGFPISLACR